MNHAWKLPAKPHAGIASPGYIGRDGMGGLGGVIDWRGGVGRGGLGRGGGRGGVGETGGG